MAKFEPGSWVWINDEVFLNPTVKFSLSEGIIFVCTLISFRLKDFYQRKF